MADSSAVLFGNALLYVAPYDDTGAQDFPADTVDYGTTWGAPFDEVGYTQEGINLNMSTTRGEIVADQVLDPLFRPVTGRSVSVAANLIEITAGNLALGLGQGDTTTTAPGAGTRGYDEYTLESTVTDDYRTWGIDAEQPADGEPFRVIVWKGLAAGNLSTAFGQRATAARIPVEIQALPDDSVTPARILSIRDYVPATS